MPSALTTCGKAADDIGRGGAETRAVFGLSPTSIVTPLTPLRIARGTLMTAWSTGDAAQAANALLEFAKANEDNLRTHRPEGADVRAWASRVSD